MKIHDPEHKRQLGALNARVARAFEDHANRNGHALAVAITVSTADGLEISVLSPAIDGVGPDQLEALLVGALDHLQANRGEPSLWKRGAYP